MEMRGRGERQRKGQWESGEQSERCDWMRWKLRDMRVLEKRAALVLADLIGCRKALKVRREILKAWPE
jgi:hypothetical protein